MKNNEEKEIKEDISKYAALDSLYLTEGGQILANGFTDDIISNLKTIAYRGKELTHHEFIALSMEIKERLNVLSIFMNAKNNKDGAKKALDEISTRIKESTQYQTTSE